MAYEVTVEQTTACPIAVVKVNTTWREFPALWPTLLGEVWTFLGTTPGLRADGHNVMIYKDGATDLEVAVEVGVQVTGSFDAVGRVVPSMLPAGDTAATLHTGAPSELGAAHGAVRAWCAAAGREVTGVRWEIYGDPDPETGHFDVTVHWQLA